MRRVLLPLLFLGGFMALSACGSDKAGSEGDDVKPALDLTTDLKGELTVETDLNVDTIPAGETFTVDCYVEDETGPVTVLTEVVVTADGDSFLLEPGANTIETVGEYEVACRTVETGAVDPTPASLAVTLGKVVKVETSLDKGEVNAGDTAEATCTAFDAFGNSGTVTPGVTSEPAEGVTIDGQAITGDKPGAYVISCNVEKGIELLSADLTVVEGVPYKFIAAVDPAEVGVGEYATVSCAIEDVKGNPVLADWKVDAPADIVVSDVKVHTTKAGTHKIKCAPVEKTGDEKLVAADLTVLPGPPVNMLIYPKPDKDHYCLGDPVQIKHELVDEYDNVIGDGEIEPIVVTPAEGLPLQENKTDKFIFAAEGTYHLEIQAVDYEYSGEVDLLCDCTGPKITITWPPRGATLTGADDNIVVTGYVEDAVSDVVGLTVNGEEVQLDASDAFSFPMDLGYGMTVIKAEATDALGNTGRRYRSPFYSTKYIPADSLAPVPSMVDKAIMVFLSQEFIDDGDHSLPADDLATIVEQMLSGFDFAGMLPEEGIAVTDKFTAYIKNVEVGEPTVSLQSVDGGIHLTIVLADFMAEIEIEGCYELPFVGELCDTYYGFIYADSILADAYLFINIAADGTIDAGLGPIEVEFENLDVDIQGLVGNLLDPIVNALVNIFKQTLIQQIQDEFGTQLPQMVKDALEGLKEGQVIELPPFIGDGDPVELLLSINFDLLQFTYDGLDLLLDAALTAFKGVQHAPLGAIARDGCMGTEMAPFVLPKDSEMNAGIALDFVNEALFSVWYSGAITLNLTQEDLADLDLSQYGLENLSLSTDLHYAPVLMSCGTGEAMELQLGDAFIHAEFFMMQMDWDLDIFLYLVLEATPKLMENEETGAIQIGIEIGELKVAEVDVVEVRKDLVGKEDMVENLFKSVLLPTLMDQLLGGLGGFDLPSFDLSGLSESIPEGTEISVDLQELAVDAGYLVVGGKLK